MKAFDYFKVLNTITRGSYNEKAVATYVCDIAKGLGLNYEMDNYYNVKVFKDNKSNKTIILQAHLDMVCEKLKDVDFDFEKQPINTVIEDDYIFAKGTTLGGDDGFGVALILEMLENCGDGYPNIEAIFTTSEEVGMDGAKNIDLSNLKGKIMIGLDGTNSSELIISCAGSTRLDFEKDFNGCCGEQNCKNANEQFGTYLLEVSGLLGGHSGEDIDKTRANANIVTFNILKNVSNYAKIKLVKVTGGGKDNAIPRECSVLFQSSAKIDELQKSIKDYLQNFDAQYTNEKDRKISVKNAEISGNFTKLSNKESKDLIGFITDFNNGVLEKANGMVVSSINLANVKLENNKLVIRTMQRFNSTECEHKELNNITLYCKNKGYKCIIRESSPFFENKKGGKLQEICEKAYYENGYKDLQVLNIHAGLEGGVFANKIKDLQVVVLGADLYDIHTPNEKMKISSLDKLSKWIKSIMLKI